MGAFGFSSTAPTQAATTAPSEALEGRIASQRRPKRAMTQSGGASRTLKSQRRNPSGAAT
jgi:hypothetical protein